MAGNRKLTIEIAGDAKGAGKAFSQLSSDASGFGTKVDGASKKAGETFTKFGVGALAVAGAVGVGLFKTGQSASHLGESINAVNVTFGKSAAGILKLGENAADAVGLSNVAFNGLAVQFSSFAETIAGKGGDVVFTIEEMTGRAADFASVMDIDVAEAARLFQSGLAGETEPLKKFGIDLSAAAVNAYAAANGIGAVGRQLTESEKVTARYGLLMESTSKTQGDFANTADSAANAARRAQAKMENASASIGAAFTPIMAAASGAIASVAGGFASLNEASDGWVAKGAGILAVGAGVVGTFSLVVGQTIKMKDRIDSARDGLSFLHGKLVNTEGGLTRMGKAAKGVGVALGLAAIGYAAYNFQQKHDAEQAESVRKALDEVTRASDEQALTIVHGLIVAWKSWDDLNPDQVVAKLARENLAAATTTRDLAMSSADARARLEGQGVTVAMLTRAIDAETAAQAKAQGATEKATTAVEEQTAAVEEAIPVIDHGAVGIENLNRQLAFQQQRATDAARATDDLRTAQLDALGGLGDYTQSVRDLDTAYYNLQTQLFENAVLQGDGTVANRDKEQSSRDLASAEHDMAGEVFATAEKFAAEKGAVAGSREQVDLMRESLRLARDKYPELRDEIDKYIAKLNEIQPTITTSVLLKFAGATGAFKTAAGGTPPGGSPGGLTWVGEQGPELLNLPRGAEVFSNADSRAMAGGATVVVNVYPQGHVMVERDLVRSVTDGIIDAQARGEIPVGAFR